MADADKRTPADEKAWRDAGFLAAEMATLELSLRATPAQRLDWLEEAIQFAWAAGAFTPRQVPPGWEIAGAPPVRDKQSETDPEQA